VDVLQQIAVIGVIDPTLDRDLEDDDSGLCGQTRGRYRDAALAQRVCYPRGESRILDQLSLLKPWAGRNNCLALAHLLASAALKEDAGSR
jgi:hypothetical protein